MEKIVGISASNGIAIGKLFVWDKEKSKKSSEKANGLDEETARFKAARKKAKEQLSDLRDKALKEAGETGASIFDMHILMLEDTELSDLVKEAIESRMLSAEKAVEEAANVYIEKILNSKDQFFADRVQDIKDVSGRIIDILLGNSEAILPEGERVVLFTESITPGEVIRLGKERLLGIVTNNGSPTSHTAILARGMGIPAITGVDILSYMEASEKRTDNVILDASEGFLFLNPEDELVSKYRVILRNQDIEREALLLLKGKPAATKSGRKVNLFANVGSIQEAGDSLENDAEGIGLFRSELLYINREGYPSEEEQFKVYKEAAKLYKDKPVVIRTLDIGADKKAEGLDLDYEENPALGYRAIRISLSQPDIFKTQLRAILRAAAFGNVKVLYPMITSLSEVAKIFEYVDEVRKELDKEGIACGEVKHGVMIETPAAVMISDLLAEKVDFFSIGTNDLTQYALALDRNNAKLTPFFDIHHEAIYRMIEMTVQNGHRSGISVDICGELAADEESVKRFLAMGVDGLSVSPSNLLSVKKIICELD